MARRILPRLWRRLRLAGLLLGFLVVATGAEAQEPQAPISLFPPTAPPPELGESSEDPGQSPSLPSGSAVETPQYEGIQVDNLSELDPDSLGILDLANGGLGPKVWDGSQRPRIAALLRSLPDRQASPTLRSLTTRLLLSSAKAPGGTARSDGARTVADALAVAQAGGPESNDFLRLRAEHLYAMGELGGLNRLLDLVPQRVDDPWLAEARVDGLLLAGRDAEACGLVPGLLARYPQELYWSKAQVFCQFIAEQADQALLGLDLLREQAPENESAFFVLADGFISGAAPDVGDAELTPLTLAMLRKTGGTLSMDHVETAGPLLLHGVAGLSGGDPSVRAAAVERLVEIGALPGERLSAAYDALEFTEAELSDALNEVSPATGVSGLHGRALLYRAADRETLAATRAELLRAVFLSAEQEERANALARTALPLMKQLAPTPELAWFAPTAARNLFRIGQFERAGAWLSVLRIDGLKHPESQEAYAALAPLRRLAGGRDPLSDDVGETEERTSAARRLLMLMLSRALGQDERLSWMDVADTETGAPLPRLANLLALGDAAAAGRRGEAVLLTITALGEQAPADSHPLALGYAVSALTAIGLGGEARALAIEAALAAGI